MDSPAVDLSILSLDKGQCSIVDSVKASVPMATDASWSCDSTLDSPGWIQGVQDRLVYRRAWSVYAEGNGTIERLEVQEIFMKKLGTAPQLLDISASYHS